MNADQPHGEHAAVEGAAEALHGLAVIVAHGRGEMVEQLASIVGRRHAVLCRCNTIQAMFEAAAEKRPQLIVTGIEFSDGDGIEAAVKLGSEKPVPTVIVAERRSLGLVQKAMADHVMAYLVEPIDPIDLEAAIVVARARFEQFEELAGEVDSLRQALADRKVIERAKGAIMADQQVEEAEAFAILRTRAQNARTKLVEVAQGILEHGPSFQPAAGSSPCASDAREGGRA
ncbi:MAG: ANTAR domain-containing protein [Phycisphaerales bacterium]